MNVNTCIFTFLINDGFRICKQFLHNKLYPADTLTHLMKINRVL